MHKFRRNSVCQDSVRWIGLPHSQKLRHLRMERILYVRMSDPASAKRNGVGFHSYMNGFLIETGIEIGPAAEERKELNIMKEWWFSSRTLYLDGIDAKFPTRTSWLTALVSPVRPLYSQLPHPLHNSSL